MHGNTQELEEHEERLLTVLRKLEQSGMTLNKDKCTLSSTKVKFLGQILSDKGINSVPENVARRFLGMVNHLASCSTSQHETLCLNVEPHAGKVVKEHSSRSYEVSTNDGNFRRNCRDLVSAHHMSPEEPLYLTFHRVTNLRPIPNNLTLHLHLPDVCVVT